MSPKQKNINIIHNCEVHFHDWLISRLAENGILVQSQENLSVVLTNHGNSVDAIGQHLKPLQKWNKSKDECYSLSVKLNGKAENNKYLADLMERTAFEGQILWLTLQQD